MPPVRRLPRAVWILCLGTFLNKFGSFVIPFLALYMTARGFALSDAGWAISSYGFGHLLASLLGGYMADRWGRRPTIVFSMFSAAVCMCLLARAESLASIILLAGLTGLASELYRPASSGLLADLVPEEDRVVAFSLYRWAINAGWAFGPATAGFLSTRSFDWLFWGDALSSAAFGVVALVALPRGVKAPAAEAGWVHAMKRIRRDGRFLQVLACSFLLGLVFLQMSSTFGVHLKMLGFTPGSYGLLISLNGLLIVIFELPLVNFTRFKRPRHMMSLGYLLIGCGFAGIALASTTAHLIAVVVTFTVGEMIALPVASAYVARLSPADCRGRYAGANGLVWAVALMIGPPLGMAALSVGPRLFWVSCGFLGLAAAGLILPWKREAAVAVPAGKVLS